MSNEARNAHMRIVANRLDTDVFPTVYGQRMAFAVLVWPFGDSEGGNVDYISNGTRDDMLTAMKEFIARAEGRVIETGTKQ